MSWLKIDDGFYRHRKVDDLFERHSRIAKFCLADWLLALNYSASVGSPFITITAWMRVTRETKRSRALARIAALVDVGLLDETEGPDVHFHDWADYQRGRSGSDGSDEPVGQLSSSCPTPVLEVPDSSDSEDRTRTGEGQNEDRTRTERGQVKDRTRTGEGQNEDRTRTGVGQLSAKDGKKPAFSSRARERPRVGQFPEPEPEPEPEPTTSPPSPPPSAGHGRRAGESRSARDVPPEGRPPSSAEPPPELPPPDFDETRRRIGEAAVAAGLTLDPHRESDDVGQLERAWRAGPSGAKTEAFGRRVAAFCELLAEGGTVVQQRGQRVTNAVRLFGHAERLPEWPSELEAWRAESANRRAISTVSEAFRAACEAAGAEVPSMGFRRDADTLARIHQAVADGNVEDIAAAFVELWLSGKADDGYLVEHPFGLFIRHLLAWPERAHAELRHRRVRSEESEAPPLEEVWSASAPVWTPSDEQKRDIDRLVAEMRARGVGLAEEEVQ